MAKQNPGTAPGQFAAALMIDYVLVVAVGISAAKLVSAMPAVQPHTLTLCLVVLGLIAAINLRGTRESGLACALPTYLFVVSLFGVIAVPVPAAVRPARRVPDRPAEQAFGPADRGRRARTCRAMVVPLPAAQPHRRGHQGVPVLQRLERVSEVTVPWYLRE